MAFSHELVATTGADELMVTTMVYDQDERMRSYERLAEIAGLAERPDLAARVTPAVTA